MAKLKARQTIVDDFAKMVEKKRKELKLSRRGLAKATGLTNQTIRNVENGAEPKLFTIYRLEKTLGVLRA
jgi:ribosome-binding protein aMBF1 (putative translation factor)